MRARLRGVLWLLLALLLLLGAFVLLAVLAPAVGQTYGYSQRALVIGAAVLGTASAMRGGWRLVVGATAAGALKVVAVVLVVGLFGCGALMVGALAMVMQAPRSAADSSSFDFDFD